MHILLAEDDAAVAGQIRRLLLSAGVEAVDVARDQEDLNGRARQGSHSIIIVRSLCDSGPVEAISQLRNLDIVLPILAMSESGRGRENADLLDAGASNVISPPIHPGVVIAMMRALLRRTTTTAKTIVRAGTIEVDLTMMQVWVTGTRVALTPYEFRLVRCLAQNLGKVVVRDALLAEVREGGVETRSKPSNSLGVLIGRIRSKLGEEGTRIKTVREQGYVLNA
jgi:DNA-binding response OmpR family regulator